MKSGVNGGTLRPGFVVAKEARLEDAPDGASEMNIVAALQKLFPDLYASPTGAKKGCRRKEVLLEGKIATTTDTVQVGQLLQLVARARAPPPPQTGKQGKKTQAEEQRPGLEVVFEDDHLAVVVKPPGLPTQGRGHDTLQHRIKYCLKPSQAVGASNRPYNIHRLDAPTSGLVVCAKSRLAGSQISGQFAKRGVDKKYLAIVKGKVGDTHSTSAPEEPPSKAQKVDEAGTAAPNTQAATEQAGTASTQGTQSLPSGLVDHKIGGKQALTEWQVLKVTPSRTHGHLTTLALHPLTGRKHQLRRHCWTVLGCGILGDVRYREVQAPKRGREGGSEQAQGAPAQGNGEQQQKCKPQQQQQQQQQQQSGEAHQQGAPEQQQQQQEPADDQDDEGDDDEEDAGVSADGTHLCLCAAELKFSHPLTGQQLHFQLPEPPYFEAARQAEAAGQS